MAGKTGVAHIDKIAEQYDEYLALRLQKQPNNKFEPIPFYEMISPNGGWYHWHYQWTANAS